MSTLVENKVYRYFWSLLFGESLKSEIAWDHIANRHCRLTFFIQRLQKFFILVTFLRFLTFFYFNVNVFYTYGFDPPERLKVKILISCVINAS